MAEFWTLSEQKNGILQQVSFELLAWTKKLINNQDQKICSLVLAKEISDLEVHKLIEYGADKVYLIKNDIFKDFLVDPYAKVIIDLIQEYQPRILIASATTTGRTIMPFISASLHIGLTADCTGLEIEPESGLLLQTRPAIGGNILATIKTPHHRPQMATVRPKSIPLPRRDVTRDGEINPIEFDSTSFKNRVVLERFISEENGDLNIENAEVIVAGGKGLKNKKNFSLIDDLVSSIGGVAGSSRPPVDQGWRPYSMQIGLSGKTISPELYIACGISGSVQHLAGIQTAKNIIAINNDPDAQIFQVADFGIVADLFEFIPVLTHKIEEEKERFLSS